MGSLGYNAQKSKKMFLTHTCVIIDGRLSFSISNEKTTSPQDFNKLMLLVNI